MNCHKPDCEAPPYVVTKERESSPPVVWCKKHWLASEPDVCYFQATFLTRDIQVPGDTDRPLVVVLPNDAAMDCLVEGCDCHTRKGAK